MYIAFQMLELVLDKSNLQKILSHGVSGTERAAGAQPSYQTLENPIQ